MTIEADLVEKFKILRDVWTKVNEKVSLLEQRLQSSQELNINESYYEILSSRFNQVRDLGDLTEKELLQEIESKIDINKEEEFIEGFI